MQNRSQGRDLNQKGEDGFEKATGIAAECSLCCGKDVSCDLDQPRHQSSRHRWVVSNRYGYTISRSYSPMIPVDDVAYVWWYDNQGAIQSHGINFVKDLPYFLVLLLCFERFTPSHWGNIPIFGSAESDTDHCLLSFPPRPPSLSTVKVEIHHTDKIRGHFGIVGRATHLLPAKSDSTDPRDVSESLKGKELVAKVYWPEASRVGEGEIIERAHQIAKHNDSVNGHIPDLVYSNDFDDYSTKKIRVALGIEPKRHRLLRVMLFRRLYPITDLTGDRFWKAFWECFCCKCATPCCNVLTILWC